MHPVPKPRWEQVVRVGVNLRRSERKLLKRSLLLAKCQRASGAMLDTLGCNLLQTILDSAIERGRHTDVEASSNKRQPQRLGRQFSQLHADATQDAFAGFKDDSTRLVLLLEFAALLPETAGIGTIVLGVRLQGAIPRRPAIAMQAARGFNACLLFGEPGAGITSRNARDRVRGSDERAQFGFVQPPHHAGKRFVGPRYLLAQEKAVNAFGCCFPISHGTHKVGHRTNRPPGSEHLQS